MAEPVRKAKSAILYPSGLNTLIIGDRGTGRFQFAKAMSNYARDAHFIDDKKKIHIVECLNYSGTPDNTLLKLLFGEYIAKTNTWKRGLFQPVSYTHLDVYKRQSSVSENCQNDPSILHF